MSHKCNFQFSSSHIFNGKKKVKLILIYLAQYTNFFFLVGVGVGASLVAQTLKKPSIMWRPGFHKESIYNVETWVPRLGWEDSLVMATHSSILA